jgi:hypothetical protein
MKRVSAFAQEKCMELMARVIRQSDYVIRN